MENKIKKPFDGPMLLCIVDGFGLSKITEGNAVKIASTPVLDNLFATYPHSELITHGEVVGLPKGQMGNSEVGHMTIGSGRTILQNLDLIRKQLSGDMTDNQAWKKALNKAKKSDKIHLIGMISDGGVHSHLDHLVLLCERLEYLNKPIIIHAILDGRDTDPKAGVIQLKSFMSRIEHLKNIHIADICGRFYAMDRDNNWDRVEPAYKLYTETSNHSELSVIDAINEQYKQGNNDEFVEATSFALVGGLSSIVEANDSILFFNFRADRMRQIVHKFIAINSNIICMTEYDSKNNNKVITLFPPTIPQNTIGEVIASLGGKQLRIAESEKYAHVTFFLNGGMETPFALESRIVVASPKVRSYDLAPKMSLEEVTLRLIKAIKEDELDLIILNIANGDQVGHSGNLEASIEAVEYIDQCIGKIVSCLEKISGEMVLIADHGNCEEMLTIDGNICTSHTLNPVPFLYVGRDGFIAKNGNLADVAPTILKLMNITIPMQMTGIILLEKGN